MRHLLIDPISHEIMRDPVTAEDGHTYERDAIEKWFKSCHQQRKPVTSPLTNKPISESLFPNISLRQIIQELDNNFSPGEEIANAQSVQLDAQQHQLRTTFSAAEALSSEVFTNLDRVMDLPTVRGLNLKVAQVVALGMESHGKSTLLERLISLPIFPKDRQRCTICPIRVHLRRTATVKIAEVFIRNCVSGIELHKEEAAMEVIAKKVDERMKIILTLETGCTIAENHEIVINFGSPSMPNLDLLDLPGLVGASLGGHALNLTETTFALADRVVREERHRSIFLLVVDVRSQVNHSRAAEIVRKNGVERQTIGVFTKWDCYVAEEDEGDGMLQKLTEEELLRTHGWLACASRKPPPAQLQGREIDRLAETTALENQLFSKAEFADAARHSRVGISSVRGRVLALFEDFLCHSWIPNIVAALKDEMRRLISLHIGDCGLPIPRQNGAYDAVAAQLQTALPQCFPGTDFSWMLATADDAQLFSLISQRLISMKEQFLMHMQLRLEDDGIFAAIEHYDRLTAAPPTSQQSNFPVKATELPLHQAVVEANTQALRLCVAIVDGLCAKVTTFDFASTFARVPQSVQWTEGSANESLQANPCLNLSRFACVFQLLNESVQPELLALQQQVQSKLKESLRDFAAAPTGGFVRSKYRRKSQAAPLAPSQLTPTRHLSVVNTPVWNPAALGMSHRLVDMWYEMLCASSVLQTPIAEDELSLLESCEATRLDVLRNLLVCAQVSQELLQIERIKPKLAFSSPQLPPPRKQCAHPKDKFRKQLPVSCLTRPCLGCQRNGSAVPGDYFSCPSCPFSVAVNFYCSDCFQRIT